MTKKELFTVLLVEDDASDALLVRYACEEADLPVRLLHVLDGVEALAFLQRKSPWQGMPRPDLILTDLNMPRMDGLTLLEKLKSDPTWCDIPTVILSTSCADSDILLGYQHHAAGYLVKPMDMDRLSAQLTILFDYWRNLVTRPRYAFA